MAAIVYSLCAATALICCALLFRGYRQSRAPLLLWSGLCFVGLTVENLMYVIDRILVPELSLSLPGLLVALTSVGGLLYGIVWKTK